MSSKILITGSTGYIGKSLTKKYLESTDDELWLLIRVKDQTDFQNTIEKLNYEFNFPKSRVTYCACDLNKENPLAEINPKAVKSIIHTAAITRFNVSQEEAKRINVQGTIKLLQFAETCPNIVQVGLLSSIYSSGLRPGLVEEKPLSNELGFANYYEWSKWESERCALETFAHLPCFIFRSATVIADSDDGFVTQYNVFHTTLRLIYQGLLTLLPGNSQTPIYLVTGKFVTEAIFQILSLSPQKNPLIFNLAPTKDQSATLNEIINIAFEVFSQDEQFVKLRIGKPRYINLETFKIVTNQVDSFGNKSMQLAISSMQPFAQQLFIEKEIINQQTSAIIEPYPDFTVQELITRTCSYLLRTDWGRAVSTLS